MIKHIVLICLVASMAACTSPGPAPSPLDAPSSDTAEDVPSVDGGTLADVSGDSGPDMAEADSGPDVVEADSGPDVVAGTLTYHKDVRPILEQHCLSCHLPGGAAGFALSFDTFGNVHVWAEAIVAATGSGQMPPWPPSAECREYKHQRVLGAAEVATLSDWVVEGKVEGDPLDFVPPISEVVNVEPSDLSMDAGGPYTPDATKNDDYYCLPMTYTVPEDAFLTGYNVMPDAKNIVHHALVFRLPKSVSAELDANDAATEEVGYPCGATPQTSQFEYLGSWVPGQPPSMLPPDTGIHLHQGDRFVLQMHYNLLALAPGEAPPGDQTGLELWTRPLSPLPSFMASYSLAANPLFAIPAGDAHHVVEGVHATPEGATMAGIFPHMHLLGKEIRLKLLHADGTETCLIDIPHWDFAWQQYFMFKDSEFVTAQPSDLLILECVFDNSQENQPSFNGVKQTPKVVTWGEGTTDEMCLAFPLWLNDCPGEVCPDLISCIANCTEGKLGCFLTCAGAGGAPCSTCATDAIYQCGINECPEQAAAYVKCTQDCPEPGCCDGAINTWYGCAETALKAGDCDSFFLCCGAQFGP